MIRETIKKLAGYTPGEQPNPATHTIKLNTNENPYPPTPAVSNILKNIHPDILKIYPPADAISVREATAKLLNINPEEVIVGNGSDDILTMVHRLSLEQGTNSCAMAPTYTLYRTLAKLQGAELNELDFAPDYKISQEFLQNNAPLKLLPNPNAPTGTLINKEDIKKLCELSQGIVVIDEAYIDFAPDNASAVDLINQYSNLLICRTLSKSYSLAGLRLGLGIANAELISQMHKIRDSYNVDIISQLIATEALNDSAWMKTNAKKIIKTRMFLDEELTKRNWQTIKSHTNFIFCQPPKNISANLVYKHLKSQNILVRHFKDNNIKNFIRISIGSDDECRSLLTAIDSL